MHVHVTRTHLELPSIDALRPAREPDAPTLLERQRPISIHEYRAIYTLVGERWYWRDRLRLTDDELARYLASPDVHVWILRVKGEPAGFFELQRYADTRVEIMYFGLAPAFIGQGLGGWMLTRAVQEAFALGAARVTLHTCTEDAPAALPNYLARGFSKVREEYYTVDRSLSS